MGRSFFDGSLAAEVIKYRGMKTQKRNFKNNNHKEKEKMIVLILGLGLNLGSGNWYQCVLGQLAQSLKSVKWDISCRVD